MRLIHFISLALILWTPPCLLAQERPNIVLLLADDLGWTGLSSFGSDLYETPHLDAMASRGMKFTNAYAACTVCSPTRASIMTGQYPARLRLTDFISGQNRAWAKLRVPDWQKGLLHEHTTLAKALSARGYRTGMVGKWHLERPGHAEEDRPSDHGFDVEHRRPAGSMGYHLPQGLQKRTGRTYLTDYLTDRAVDFIQDSASSLATPFFLYMAYHVPHTPIQGRQDLVERFRKKVRPEAVHRNPDYAAMVASLDESVGRILEALEEAGASDDTLVIFTSDNGGLTQRYGKHDGFTENLPLRLGKGSAYEGGVRVPTIILWPNVIKPGSVCHTPIASIDYYPTLLAAAGKNDPAAAALDGVDLRPLLNDPETSWDRDLFWHYPHYHAGGDSPYSAIRSGKYRLIEFHEDEKRALYDLEKDLGEQNNLAEIHPEIAERLYKKLQTWREEIGAQMPTPNPNHDPARAQQVKLRRR